MQRDSEAGLVFCRVVPVETDMIEPGRYVAWDATSEQAKRSFVIHRRTSRRELAGRFLRLAELAAGSRVSRGLVDRVLNGGDRPRLEVVR